MSIRSNTSFPPIETRGLGTASLVSNGLTVAAERWNVEKKRMEMDEDIEKFYNGKVAKCLEVDKIANERITKLYNDIYYKVKWSNPPLPVVYQKLFTDYCKHLLKEGTNVSFPGAADIKAWKKKMVGSIHDKVACEADKLCKTLRDTIQKRDTDLINIQAQLITTTEKKNIHKDGTLRWMMETNVGKKDEYFTVWYLAAHGKIRELDVLINAPSKQAHIDDRDPDFGLTPLHFACKTVKLSMVQYLMSKGADIHLRTPDGRTPLHLAAAYSTREVVLELLGACVDFDAVDNYGCTALHMAEQNRNSSTTETLRKWSTLTMLPSELEQLNSQQRSPEGSVQSPGLSAHKSFTGMDGNIGGTSAYSAAFPRSSAPEFHHQATVASEMQLTVFQNFDPNVPWEYQPIPADSLKLMSPSLSLLTKRLNAYNMFLIRTESNYVPTEMLSSRDLRNISGMLHRSATSLLQASQVSGEQYHSSLHSMGSSLLLDCGGNESVAQVPLVGEISFAQSESHVQSTKTESQLYIDTSASVGELCSNGEYKFGNESEMFRSSHQTENFDFSSEFNECLVEIRLTTKHYAQCVQENLIEEAMRSLRRRWMVAKRLWDLIVREKAQREHQEQLQRKEQETHMAALLADQEHYQMQYDEQGVPKVVVAGLLEYSSSVVDSRSGGDGACGLVRGSSEEDFNHKTGNSEDAVNLSAPHPKYAPSLAEGSEQSSSPLYSNTHNYDTNIALSPISVDVAAANFSVHSQFDIYPNIPPQEDEEDEGSVDGSSSGSRSGPAPPPFDLERIALCFEETQERIRQEELNPDPENQSSSTLKRPADYDSIGVGVYKVRDNVYWETESSKLRMDATPFSEDTSTHPSSQSVSAVVSAPVHLSGAEATDAANDPKDIERESAAAMSPPDIESAVNEVGEPLLSFVPTVSQESDAWAVIQKWHLVADARIRRRPNFDLYLTSNDELISTSSQLTYSVTEAPSTGGFGASLGPNSCSKGGLDSPSVFSQGSSYMLDQVQSYGHTAGPFKDTVRGNYVIKLGLDLVNVHIVRKEEGSALKILHECCEINDEVEVTQKIALLERRCDLLLHIHDFLQRIVREIEYSLKPPVHSSGPPKLKLHFPMARTEVSVRTIMNSRVLEMMDAVEFVEAQLSYDQHEEGQNIDRPLNDDSNILHPTTESSGDKPPPTQAVSIDPSPLRYLTDTSDKPHSDITENIADAATTAATFSEIPPAAVQFATPVDDQSAIRSESNTAIQRLEKVQGQLLSQIAHFTSLSVALHREHYKDDIAEPSTLAVALLQRARAAERAYDGVQAMHYTEQAEVVAARALGAGSQLAISIMLENLRLHVKYRLAEVQDLAAISLKAVNINKYIVQFSFIDLHMADRFTKKCIEYVAISTVAIKQKEAEKAREVAAEKLESERLARKKLIEAQQSVLKRGKR